MKKGYIINSGGLEVYYDADLLRQIEKKLGRLQDQKYQVLRNAINATLGDAKKDLVNKAQEEYTAKKGPLGKATKTKKATASNPEGTITVKGGVLDLKDFKTRSPASGSQAQVLTSSGLKLIQSQRGSRAKAFLVKFRAGTKSKAAIAQRQDGETYSNASAISRRQELWGKGADMTAIKKLLSVSFPKMVGSERVYGEIAPDIYDKLQANIKREIAKVINA